MLSNFIRVAFRNLVKQRIYSIINIIGLAVSITACLLITLYVRFETSFDSGFPDADRIFKVVLERKYPDRTTFFALIPQSYAAAMKKDFPEVENTLQLLGPNNRTVVNYEVAGKETISHEEDQFYFVPDSTFFSFFNLPFIRGDQKTALSGPNQVVITREVADRYFGTEDPIGKVLRGNFGELRVTGVIEKFPENSHIQVKFVATFNAAQFFARENYISFSSHTYLKLKPGSDADALEAKFPQMVDTYASGQIERQMKQSWEDYKKAGNGYRYFLQPLREIHLDPTNLEFTPTPSGNKRYVLGLTIIAGMILVIACINFMNLATARSTSRAREVGMRKVMGSMKNQLVFQFLLEAVLLAAFSTAIAVVAAYLLLPSFNSLTEKNLQFVLDPIVIAGLVAFAMLVGVLAGIYPAFVLSAFNPVDVMKGSFSRSATGNFLRNGLVVFQFTISVFLIVATLIVGRQMSFMMNKDLGFDKESVMMVESAFALQANRESFLTEVRKMPSVISAAGSSARVGNRDDVFGQMYQPLGSNEIFTVKSMFADDDFAPMIDFKIKEGRFFSKETSDSLNILMNEAAVKAFDLKDPVGLKFQNDDFQDGDNPVNRTFTVIGVVSNFHFQSLRDEITPLVILSTEIFGRDGNTQFIAVRVKQGMDQEAITTIGNLWKSLVPNRPFAFEFLEENLNQGYAQERQSGKVFSVFSGLAVVIACVGLFGLSAFTAGQRTKEIGIRKVLGATVPGVVMLLSKDFAKLVGLALILAVPGTWYLMDNWLSGFAYRISLGVDTFLLAGLLAIAIAMLTVSYQSIKAAVVNPVNSLRRE